MRSTVLIFAAATTLCLSACDEEEPEPPAAGSTSTTDDPTTGQPPATDDGSTSGADGTTTDAAESTGEGESSTGEEMVTCPYEDPGWQPYGQGVPIPHWELETHNGEIWRACDYYGSPMVIDTSAAWCGPCQALAAFMAGNDAAANGIFGNPTFVEDYAMPFRDMVNAGCISWITVLTQDSSGAPPTNYDAEVWDLQYHNPNIPVIADPTGDFENWLNITAYPTTFLVNNDFGYLTNDLGYGMMLVVDNLECDLTGGGE